MNNITNDSQTAPAKEPVSTLNSARRQREQRRLTPVPIPGFHNLNQHLNGGMRLGSVTLIAAPDQYILRRVLSQFIEDFTAQGYRIGTGTIMDALIEKSQIIIVELDIQSDHEIAIKMVDWIDHAHSTDSIVILGALVDGAHLHCFPDAVASVQRSKHGYVFRPDPDQANYFGISAFLADGKPHRSQVIEVLDVRNKGIKGIPLMIYGDHERITEN
jgi:hypothetical protein